MPAATTLVFLFPRPLGSLQPPIRVWLNLQGFKSLLGLVHPAVKSCSSLSPPTSTWIMALGCCQPMQANRVERFDTTCAPVCIHITGTDDSGSGESDHKRSSKHAKHSKEKKRHGNKARILVCLDNVDSHSSLTVAIPVAARTLSSPFVSLPEKVEQQQRGAAEAEGGKEVHQGAHQRGAGGGGEEQQTVANAPRFR